MKIFLDLSVDVEQNTSITHCLRGFSNTETLFSEYKYYCEECRSKQEAHKRMKVKKLPMILALHLKRFKYMDQLHRYTKLSYWVVFPLELRLFNTSGDATNPDRMYDLVAVVVILMVATGDAEHAIHVRAWVGHVEREHWVVFSSVNQKCFLGPTLAVAFLM